MDFDVGCERWYLLRCGDGEVDGRSHGMDVHVEGCCWKGGRRQNRRERGIHASQLYLEAETCGCAGGLLAGRVLLGSPRMVERSLE